MKGGVREEGMIGGKKEGLKQTYRWMDRMKKARKEGMERGENEWMVRQKD